LISRCRKSGYAMSKIAIEQDLRGVERTAGPSTTLRSG
jgi:hypothetical protein